MLLTPPHSPTRVRMCVIAAVGILLTAGCSLEGDPSDERTTGPTHSEASRSPDEPGGDRSPGGSPPPRGDTAPRGSAIAAVEELEVRGRSPKTGYSRERFGDGWADEDGNGCNTREDVLRRDLSAERTRGGRGADACEVTRGTLPDPYTGRRLTFARGGLSEVDIDHVVALSDAWQKGAQRWSRERRVAFANDPLNLLAVDATANRVKGDADAASWLPPAASFRCAYVARQVAVKREYGLRVTQAERDAMARVLQRCPGERLPRSGHPGGGGGRSGENSGGDEPVQPGAKPDRPEKPFENCAAARAAGAAPVHRGDPGYGRHLDRDGDGTGCDG